MENKKFFSDKSYFLASVLQQETRREEIMVPQASHSRNLVVGLSTLLLLLS
jgi:hypothetical protein